MNRTQAGSIKKDESPHEPLCVRISTAVRLTGIGRSKLYQLIGAGEIETIKIGTSTLIPMASLHDFIERHRARAEPVG